MEEGWRKGIEEGEGREGGKREGQVYEKKGKSDISLQVKCYDWDADGSHDLIGEFYTTLGELTQAAQDGKKVALVVPFAMELFS